MPERAAGTRRLLRIYAALVGGARSAMRAAAAAAAKGGAQLAEAEARAIVAAALEAAAAAEDGLPAGWPDSKHIDVTLSRAPWKAAAGGGVDSTALAAAAAAAPADWLVYTLRAAVHGVPNEGGEAEGSLVFEEPFVVGGAGGGGKGGLTRLGAAVPDVSCWGATPEEEREARQVRGALSGVSVCAGVNPSALEKMRAGEHSVLQLLAAAPIDTAALLTSSPWVRVVTGEVRLFSGGLSIDSPRHGPLTIPFRVHLAAAAVVDLECRDGAGLVILHQKADDHGYGPLSVLPPAEGADAPDADAPAPAALTLALVVRPGGAVQKALRGGVWAEWTRCFAEAKVPLSTLAAPPALFADAIAELAALDAAAAAKA